MRKFITFKGACVAAAACLFLPLAAGTSHAAHAQRGAAVSSLSGDIVFWHAYNTTGPENVQLITKVLPAFNKLYPNITVHSQDIPYASFPQKLVASVAGGNGPDVVRSDIIWMPQLAKIGAIATTDGIMAARKSQFYAAPVATNYYQGHYYGLPLDGFAHKVDHGRTVVGLIQTVRMTSHSSWFSGYRSEKVRTHVLYGQSPPRHQYTRAHLQQGALCQSRDHPGPDDDGPVHD